MSGSLSPGLPGLWSHQNAALSDELLAYDNKVQSHSQLMYSVADSVTGSYRTCSIMLFMYHRFVLQNNLSQDACGLPTPASAWSSAQKDCLQQRGCSCSWLFIQYRKLLGNNNNNQQLTSHVT